MRKSSAVAFFGTQTKFAAAIGKANSTVSYYPEILPLGIALLTERVTDGAVKVDPSMYPDAPEGLRQ